MESTKKDQQILKLWQSEYNEIWTKDREFKQLINDFDGMSPNERKSFYEFRMFELQSALNYCNAQIMIISAAN